MNWYVDPTKAEVPAKEIIERGENGEFHEWNYQAFGTKEIGYEDVMEDLKNYKVMYEEASAKGDTNRQKELVEEVLQIYRSRNVFPIQYYSEMGIIDEIEKCIAYKASFDGDTVSCVSGDTEYFDGSRWVRIDQYCGGKVAQYNNGRLELVQPLKYVRYDGTFDMYDYSSPNLCSCQTPDHVCIVKGSDGSNSRVSQKEVAESKEDSVLIPSGVLYDGSNCKYVPAHAKSTLITERACLEYDAEHLLALDLDSKQRLLTDMVFWSGSVLSDGTYMYESTCEENLDFAVSLAFFTGHSIKSVCRGDNVVVFSDDCVTSYTPSMFKKVRVEGKYCFEVPSHILVLRKNGIPYITGNCGAGVGTTLCDFLFPNLYDTPSKHDINKTGAETLFAKFHNDDYLRKAIQFCFGYKDGRPVPTSVMGGLRLVGSAPTNFRPMNAKAVYERFCPEGGVIYDYCCVSGDTEYFNGKRWVPISKYKYGDKVLQYNPDKSAELVDPLDYIYYKNDKPFYEYGGGIPFAVTDNHNVPYYDKLGFFYLEEFGSLMGKVVTEGAQGNYNVPASCVYNSGIDLSLDEIMRIAFAVNTSIYILTETKNKKFVKIIEDKYICPSDECYLLNGSARRLLLEAMGVCFGSNTFRCKEVANAVASLYNMSYAENHAEVEGNCVTIKHFSTVEYVGNKVEVKENPDYDYHEKYCFTVPSHCLILRRKGVVFITGNCGFGGRMLGALSSKKNFKYVGTDPNVETMYHLHQLGEYIEEVTGRENSYELHCCGSEDFRGKPNSIDFAFSSPPYFDLEVYSNDPTQCYNKFPELENWLEGYVRQTIKNIIHMLKPGRVYAVNIADFKVGSGGTCAYVDEWIRISKEEGAPLFDIVYLGVTARAGSKEQAAGELKKENILIFKKEL